MQSIARKVREAVSGDRTRYKAGGFDLDLTYITNRILAMGLPSEGVEGVYRNPIDEVARFFEWKHKNHFLIINLSERQYDYAKFDYQILEFGWPDHHAPPLDLLPRICESMHGWLQADPMNVVAVHCKAGKGRTGVVIAAYLVWSGIAKSAAEAMEIFGNIRGQKGVTIPSQRRYVDYLTETMAIGEKGLNERAKPLVLLKVLVNTIPHIEKEGFIGREKAGCRPFFDVNKGSMLLWTSQTDDLEYYKPSDGAIIVSDIRVVLWGDVYIKCYHASNKRKGKDTFVFRFAFNTAFVSSGILSLKRMELDGPHKNPADFDVDFGVDLYFGDYDEAEDTASCYRNTLSHVKQLSDDDCWKYINIKEQREEEEKRRTTIKSEAEFKARHFTRGRAQTAFLPGRSVSVEEEEEDIDMETFDFVDTGRSGVDGAFSFREPREKAVKQGMPGRAHSKSAPFRPAEDVPVRSKKRGANIVRILE